MKTDCQNCKLCLVDSGYLCRHIKKAKLKERQKSQQTATLYFYGLPIKSGSFALMSHLKSEYLRKGTPANVVRVVY